MVSKKVNKNNKDIHNEELESIIVGIDELIKTAKAKYYFAEWNYPVDEEVIIKKTEYIKFCVDCENKLSVINPSDYCSKECEKNFLKELEHVKSMLKSGEIDLGKEEENEKKEKPKKVRKK